MTLQKEIVAGALGGLVAGSLMTAFMVVASRKGLVREPLPQKSLRWAEDRVGMRQRPSPLQEEVIAQAGHLLFAAGLGAVYGAFRANWKLPAIPTGPLYGLSLYAVDLAGVGPALGITRGPWHEEPMTAGRRAMMHLIYGTVTGLTTEQVRHRL